MPASAPPPAGAKGKRKKRAKKAQGYAPSSFNLAAEMTRTAGVDALRVDGISLITFQTVVAELGTDLGELVSHPSITLLRG